MESEILTINKNQNIATDVVRRNKPFPCGYTFAMEMKVGHIQHVLG